MKKIFIITAVSAAALLSACGSTTSTSHKSPAPTKVVKTAAPTKVKDLYGYNASGTVLTLPHVGHASPTITKFASSDPPYLKQLINPKYWVKSKTFGGQWIFVGPYTSTSSVAYQRIRDAKVMAMNTMELFTIDANYGQTWPSVKNGFNYDAFGLGPISQSLVTSLYKSAVALGHATMTALVPVEATIAESPVGKLTASQMNNPKGQPQYTTQGICVPHEFAVQYTGGKNAINGGLGFSTTQEYFAGYGSPSVLTPNATANGDFTSGVESNPVKSCANFS